MNRHPLVAAVLSVVLTLQLSLVGGGAGCAMPAGRAAAGAMAGMAMPGMPADSQSSDGAHHATPPCEQSVPAASCQLMAPCLTSVAALPVSVGIEASAPTAAVDAMTVAAPPSRTTAPELPPPRA